MAHKLIAFLLLLTLGLRGEASDSLSRPDPQRVKFLAWANGITYTAGISGLYFLWYADYPMEGFHFFNDNAEWAQMDKVGHAASCYMEGLAGIEMMRWAGFNDRKAIWLGGSYGLLWQGAVEVLDGFSSGWGFSTGDMAANLLGTGLVIGQELSWQEQRIQVKYSFTQSKYAAYRPNVLGEGFIQQALKDYNGQTYWCSFNLSTFSPKSKIPDWLNVAIGYGIDGYVGARTNDLGPDYPEHILQYTRSRQFYLSPDIDLRKLHVERTWVKVALHVLNSIKFPAPALEYRTATSKLHFVPLQF
ncbi:MAG: DUF2279 domain-containing protein [Flavobacteriales bacterium]|nr:DUF2279 domain-containing protein [Flavobacteriales bacterium]